MAPTVTLADQGSARLKRILDDLLGQLDGLREMATSSATNLRLRSEAVSRWDVGEHLDHLIKADLYFQRAIESTLEDPSSNADKRPIMIARIMLKVGFIPRGKGKAPASTEPEAAEAEPLAAGFARTKDVFSDFASRLAEIEACPGRSAHPLLGAFTGSEWLRFARIHHHHHLKIIRDIQRRG